MRRLRIAGLSGFALVIALVGLAAASPGQDAKIETSEFALLFNNAGSSWASCPRNSVAVGGGLGFISSSSPPNVAINVSGPVNQSELTSHTKTGDLAREWYAGAYSGNGSDVTFKSFAICSRSSRAHLQVKKFKIRPIRVASATVSCPRHERALGGGLGVADGAENGVYEISSAPLARTGGFADAKSGKVPRRWRVSAYNGFGATRTFKALVSCARVGNAKIVADGANVNPGDTTESVAACPTGTRALGGGVGLLGSPSVDLQMLSNGPQAASGTTETTNDGDPAVYWDGDVYNRSGRSRDFKVLAVCASN